MRAARHPAEVVAVRLLRAAQRSRAALVSVLGHGAFLTLLALVGIRTQMPSIDSPLIIGELFTASPWPAENPMTPAEPAATTVEEPAPAPELPPEAAPPPRAAEAVSPPPIAEPQLQPVEPPERALEPATEPAPEERLAEVPPPEAEPLGEVPEAPEAVAAEGLPAAASTDTAEDTVRSLASHEQRAVQRRLSSFTGGIDIAAGATLEWRDDGQDYTAKLKRVPATDAMGMEQLLIELTTERDGERLMTELRMKRLAFSNFAQFIDRWDPEVQIHDDLIDGRFHSNTEIRVSRESGVQPVFSGKVTVAGGDIRTDGVGYLNRRTMFPGGLETRVRRIGLPPRAAAFDDGAVTAERVRRIAQDSLLTFNADGTFESRAATDGAAAELGALGEEPFYIVAAEGVDLRVRGVVNGKVLVYSPEHIVIVDDIRYLADPREPGADDYLGLVAERSVEIDEPEVTGPGDLEVHASIYARNRFSIRDFRSRRSGTLIIYGSVTAGSVSATEPRFATRIEFDDRLATMRAPGFPLSDRYELDTASGEWRVADSP
jgi:hypothetical protein